MSNDIQANASPADAATAVSASLGPTVSWTSESIDRDPVQRLSSAIIVRSNDDAGVDCRTVEAAEVETASDHDASSVTVHMPIASATEVSAAYAMPAEEVEALKELNGMYRLIEDRVNQVIDGSATCLILSGPGGIGKSHLVLQTLKKAGIHVELYNSQITPKRLYLALKERPEGIFVLEDMEQLFANKFAAGLLRSALWSQDQRNEQGRWPRTITWQRSGDEGTFIFYGGLIVLMNGSLPNTQEMLALKTRVSFLELSMTELQMRAKMRELALRGFNDGHSKLDAMACCEVFEFLIRDLQLQKKPANLRMLFNAFRDRCSFDAGRVVTPWQELVRSSISQVPGLGVEHRQQNDKLESDLKIVTEIHGETPDPERRVRLFVERTGQSRPTYYRRKKELELRLAAIASET